MDKFCGQVYHEFGHGRLLQSSSNNGEAVLSLRGWWSWGTLYMSGRGRLNLLFRWTATFKPSMLNRFQYGLLSTSFEGIGFARPNYSPLSIKDELLQGVVLLVNGNGHFFMSSRPYQGRCLEYTTCIPRNTLMACRLRFVTFQLLMYINFLGMDRCNVIFYLPVCSYSVSNRFAIW